MNLIETRDNNYTICIDNINIHSKYSPIKEAKKYIIENLKPNGTVIVLGAGLGYLFKAIEELSLNIEVISIPYSKELGELSLTLNNSNRKQWNFNTPISKYLSKVITAQNISNLQVMEWQPTAKTHKETADLVNKNLIQIIRRINGNLLTTARFGKLWIKNSIRNYLKTNEYITDIHINKPIIIVASGVSLHSSFKTIKEIREKIILISLSSANMALNNNGIEPDITFSTDPGYYSKLHLHNYKGIIAMPLSNSTSNGNPVLLLNQGNKFEKDIISLGKLPNIKIKENGTVAGTALEFALKYSKGTIYLFGQDLASSDLNTHVRPYSFDNLLSVEQMKYNPLYSIMFKRFINQGVSYSTYRDWFSKISMEYPGRIKRVNSASNKIQGLDDIELCTFIRQINSESDKTNFTYKKTNISSLLNRVENIETLLNNWLVEVKSEEINKNELFYLISTSNYTDIISKTTFKSKETSSDIRNESIQFIKRLLKFYGHKLL